MPRHEFECRRCDTTVDVVTAAGESPAHPTCPACHQRMGRNFSFTFGRVEIDVMSPTTGYHSSTRAYEDSLRRHTETTVARTGFDTEIVRTDPDDPSVRPADID